MNEPMERRILLLALRGRDSQIIERLLTRSGHECVTCRSGDQLADALAEGAGAVLVTEESLVETDRSKLVAWLNAQPPWSDFPFILLSTKRAGRRPKDAAQILNQLGNVVVLERPVHGETLDSAVGAALRARLRQYDARSHLNELQSAERHPAPTQQHPRRPDRRADTRPGPRQRPVDAGDRRTGKGPGPPSFNPRKWTPWASSPAA